MNDIQFLVRKEAVYGPFDTFYKACGYVKWDLFSYDILKLENNQELFVFGIVFGNWAKVIKFPVDNDYLKRVVKP